MDFELVERELTDGGVFALAVVVAIDVLNEFELCVDGVFKAAALEHLALEAAHEGFCPGFVIRVGLCPHALAHASACQHGPE